MNTIESATKFIESGKKPTKAKADYEENVSMSAFGLRSSAVVNLISLPLDSYAISSEPENSEAAAWEGFWRDYNKKVDDKPYTDIYWRRNIEHLAEMDFDENRLKHVVRCRFSLK